MGDDRGVVTQSVGVVGALIEQVVPSLRFFSGAVGSMGHCAFFGEYQI